MGRSAATSVSGQAWSVRSIALAPGNPWASPSDSRPAAHYAPTDTRFGPQRGGVVVHGSTVGLGSDGCGRNLVPMLSNDARQVMTQLQNPDPATQALGQFVGKSAAEVDR